MLWDDKKILAECKKYGVKDSKADKPAIVQTAEEKAAAEEKALKLAGQFGVKLEQSPKEQDRKTDKNAQK